MNSNYLKYSQNPKGYTLKKWFAELLQDRYIPYENLIERVGMALVTDKDLTDFGKLLTELYEMAYRKAVKDYKEQFEKLGVKVHVTAGP